MRPPDLLNDPNTWLRDRGGYLLLFAKQWTNNHQDAEDALNEGFMNFWPQRQKANNPISLLCQCIKRAAQSQVRSSQRRKDREQRHGTSKPALIPLSDTETQETSLTIESALQSLALNQREVVILHIWGEMTFQEISEALQTPLSTLHTRYRKALAQLEPLLQHAPL